MATHILYILTFIFFTIFDNVQAEVSEASQNVMLSVIIGKKPLFLPEFFEKIYQLDYPKDKLFLYVIVQNITKYHYVKESLRLWKNEYRSVKFLPSENPAKARQESIHYAKNFKVDSIFFISSSAHLENPTVLKDLIQENVPVVAPFLKTYETFGYARRICDLGFPQSLNDSHSFPHLVTQKGLREWNYEFIKIGNNFVTQDVLEARNSTIYEDKSYWVTIPNSLKENVPIFKKINDRIDCSNNLPKVQAIRSAYLVKTDVFPERNYRGFFETSDKSLLENIFENITDDNAVVDAIFSQTMTSKNIDLHVLNKKTYGQLVNLYDLQEDKLYPEIVRIMENHDLWERRYIQDKVRRSFNQHPYCNQTGNPGCMGELMPEILPKDTIKDGFCPDTYQFPMFTKQFCQEMIEEAEWADDWFKSGNDTVYDDRNKRKEAVPTTDINLWQYGLEEMWMAFINYYIYPRKCVVYPGHPGLDMGGHFFTVRYRWEEQPSLKPHHDNSLFSMNLALNHIGQDFEGGGTRFIRQNCTDLTQEPGTLLLHPGRVTHYHEGRSTTSGTRYIMISFVNASYPCFEREGIPYCRGFIRKKNWKEAIQRYKQISRINEGIPWQLDVKVGKKLISVKELE